MQRSTITSAVFSVGLAICAAVLARAWLQNQRETIELEVASTNPAHSVVVALHDLQTGARIGAGDVALSEWGRADIPAGSFGAVADLIATSGEARFVTATIYKDEPVLGQRLSRPGQQAKLSASIAPGMRAVSIRVNDVQGVAGFVLPGDHVDVFMSHDGGQGVGTAYIDLILQDAKIVAIDQSSDSNNELPSVVRTVTFEITPEQAQKLTLAGTIGTLSLSLRNQTEDAITATPRLSSSDLGLTGDAPTSTPQGDGTGAAVENIAVPPEPNPTVGVIRDGHREPYPIDPKPKAPQ